MNYCIWNECYYFTGTGEKLVLMDMSEVILNSVLIKEEVITSTIQETRIPKLFVGREK
jgi:hypothetical protein